MIEPKDAFDCVKAVFEGFGYDVLKRPSKEDNDCDMYVVGTRRVLKVEIKKVQEKVNGSWQADFITKDQKECDCVAVVFPNGYVFLENMSDYLSCSSNAGYRNFTWLKI